MLLVVVIVVAHLPFLLAYFHNLWRYKPHYEWPRPSTGKRRRPTLTDSPSGPRSIRASVTASSVFRDQSQPLEFA